MEKINWKNLVGKKVRNKHTDTIFKVVSYADMPSVELEGEYNQQIGFCLGSPMEKDWEIVEEEEIRTLKDIKKCLRCNTDRERCVNFNALKQEAIKWAKKKLELINGRYRNIRCDDRGWIAKQCLQSDVYTLKEFFNLTEEDLK